ncbi:MAG: hypothetical protein VB814_09425, partial [Pirellulaceae bacterium]
IPLLEQRVPNRVNQSLSKHDTYAYVAQTSLRDFIVVLVLPYGKTSATQQQIKFWGTLRGLKQRK